MGHADEHPAAGQREQDLAELLWEYVDRLNAGETIDPTVMRAEHPELADELILEFESIRGWRGDSEDKNEPLGTLGDYTLRRQIGRGGMGVVYDAWQNSMDRRVALKVLPVGLAADDRSFNRFLREARMLSTAKNRR